MVVREKEKARTEYQQKMAGLHETFMTSSQKFSHIDKQIYDRGNTALRIGEQMESVDRQKEKAAEAKLLIERFSQLNLQRDLPALMTDDSKISERAALIKKLQVVTQDLSSARHQTALQRVEQHGNEIELKLLALFEKAQSQGDFERMKVRRVHKHQRVSEALDSHQGKECAEVLFSFNGGLSVVRRYISQLPIFLNHAFWETDDSGYLLAERIKELFAKLTSTCQREHEVILKVFPSSGLVMKELLEKVFYQYVRSLVHT